MGSTFSVRLQGARRACLAAAAAAVVAAPALAPPAPTSMLPQGIVATPARLDRGWVGGDCGGCHQTTEAWTHPIGVVPSMPVPAELPLLDGRLACTTCHDSRSSADHARARMTDPTRHILIENSGVGEIRVDGRGTHRDASGSTASVTAPEAVLRGGGPIIGYAGNFEHYQGLDLLLHAFAEVIVAVPEARLLLIGGTPAQVEQHQGLAAGLDLQEKVFFTGCLGSSEARRLIGSAGVLVSPRVDGPGTPLKIYEQIASGIPLVATRILAHTQVLDDEVCMLVDATADGIARGILELLQDPESASAMARRAQSLSQTRYDWDAYARRVRRLVAGLGLRPEPSGAASAFPS